jgi:hypothetical protein
MKCLHCLTDFFPEDCSGAIEFVKDPFAFPSPDGSDSTTAQFSYATATCPNCRGAHIALSGKTGIGYPVHRTWWAFPRSGAYPPPPSQVPDGIATDYREANEVLPISPKASAALSRRCLQAILTAAGYSQRNLADQVQMAIDEASAAKALPPSLRDSLDAIRNFGNFSAHPITDRTTLQIIDVEDGEAEWCLELLVDMFDHYYVRPAVAAERRTALASKLSAAGKPPMKQGAEEDSAPANLVKDGVDNQRDNE